MLLTKTSFLDTSQIVFITLFMLDSNNVATIPQERFNAIHISYIDSAVLTLPTAKAGGFSVQRP